MRYPKYTWIGSKISEEDMSKLYNLKQKNKKPITAMVAEAIKVYIEKKEKGD